MHLKYLCEANVLFRRNSSVAQVQTAFSLSSGIDS